MGTLCLLSLCTPCRLSFRYLQNDKRQGVLLHDGCWWDNSKSCPMFGCLLSHVWVFITAVPLTKLFAWGQGGSGGHVLRETTSQVLCGLVFPVNRDRGVSHSPPKKPGLLSDNVEQAVCVLSV